MKVAIYRVQPFLVDAISITTAASPAAGNSLRIVVYVC